MGFLVLPKTVDDITQALNRLPSSHLTRVRVESVSLYVVSGSIFLQGLTQAL